MRYTEDDGTLQQTYDYVIAEYFPQYSTLSTKLIFDHVKKEIGFSLRLADILLVNEKFRFLTRSGVNAAGFDFVITVDKWAWKIASTADKVRIIRHELRHVVIDKYGKCKLRGHDIEDFYDEIALNADDPKWAARLVETTLEMYDEKAIERKRKTTNVG